MANANSSIKSIEGVPIDVAYKIYLNDGWFDGKANPGRFVKYVDDNGNLKIEKKNNPEAGFVEVTKVKTYKGDGQIKYGTQDFINLCFSVWGNKGPYLVFKDYFTANGGFPSEQKERAYLAHFAWAKSNDYSLEGDKVSKKVREIAAINALRSMLKEYYLFATKQSDSDSPIFFESPYAKAYYTFLDKDMNNNLKTDIEMDIRNAELYIDAILKSNTPTKNNTSTGGSIKKLYNMSKKTKKTKKTKKSKKSRK